VNTTNESGRIQTRKGFSAVPIFGDLLAMGRMLRDREAGWALKLTALATMFYVFCPIDALPEGIAPAIGWLDDVGLILFMRLALAKKLDVYRYPLFEKAPPRAALRSDSNEIGVREVAGRAAPMQG
jgi:uncharacterized membrane protein YkvA (DUF1232 family)